MKKGFTLAEILITLGIIGVVAALTMPALVTNSQRNTAGAALSKAFNTISNANEMMLVKNEANTLREIATPDGSSTGLDIDEYIEQLKNYAKIRSVNSIPTYTKYSGEAYISGSSDSADPIRGGYEAFRSSDGMLYIIRNDTVKVAFPGRTVSWAAGDSLASLHIDTNGSAGPNVLGKDLFQFYILNSGEIIPMGGSAYMDFKGDDSPLYLGSGANACYVDEDGNSQIGDGSTCAGYIADNGWKVLY